MDVLLFNSARSKILVGSRLLLLSTTSLSFTNNLINLFPVATIQLSKLVREGKFVECEMIWCQIIC